MAHLVTADGDRPAVVQIDRDTVIVEASTHPRRNPMSAPITMGSVCYEITALPGVEDKILPAPEQAGRGYRWPYSDDLLLSLWERVVDIYVGSQGWGGGPDVSRDRAAMKAWLDRYREHAVNLGGTR